MQFKGFKNLIGLSKLAVINHSSIVALSMKGLRRNDDAMKN